MNFVKRHTPVIILLLCTYAVLFIAMGDFLLSPNKWLFNLGGDGIKNYYTFAHYLKHGSGWWFEGMNYPNGEHFLYTDSFSIYARILNFIDNHLFTLYPYSVGIINLTVMLAFGFCSYFLYKILRHYGVADWWAIPCALCICFLSPQFIRLGFHYSLGFAMYIPMLWYFLLKMLRVPPPCPPPEGESVSHVYIPLWRGTGGGLGWSIATVSAILFFGLIHPYYLPLGSFFVLAFAGIYTLQHLFRLRKNLWTILTLFAVALLPVILFMIFTKITDSVTDRHLAPYGLWFYISQFEGVFFPNFGPIRSWWDFAKLPETQMEGMAYVGFFGLPVLIFTGLRWLYTALWKRRPLKAFQLTAQPTLNTAIGASTLLLILSFALPFIWFSFLLDWVPQLRQFRSLGRFSWAFYYVFAVYIAYYFYLFLKILLRKKKLVWAVIIGMLVIEFWAVEAAINMRHTTKDLYKYRGENTIFKDNNNYEKHLLEAGYTTDDFQAILPLPYFNNGSEKWYIYRHGGVAKEAYLSSYETGLPIAALHSARASISQAGKLIQLLSSDLIEKQLLKEINDKPFLALVWNDAKLKPDESQLIQKGKEIFKNKKITLYELPLTAFDTNFDEIRKKYQEHLSLNKEVQLPENVIWKNFDTESSPHQFRGDGAVYSSDNVQITLHDDTLTNKHPQWYEASVWVYADSSKCSFPKLFCYQYNEKNEQVGFTYVSPKVETEVYGNGSWIRAKVHFEYLSPRNRVYIYLESEDQKTTDIVADEWLLRPTDIEVFYDEDDDSFMYNNYRIPKQ